MGFSREIKGIRILNSLTQEDVAQKLGVSAETVDSWEKDEAQPDAEMLKLISKSYDVSVNTLLGSPKTLICQCCGIPLGHDFDISREPDGNFNEEYCKWCYKDGEFTYKTMDSLLDFMMEHIVNPDNKSDEERREFFTNHLSKLNYWKNK